MNANDENDLGKMNLLAYIETLKKHYVEMQKEISRLEKENLELRALVSECFRLLDISYKYNLYYYENENTYGEMELEDYESFGKELDIICSFINQKKAEKYKQGDEDDFV